MPAELKKCPFYGVTICIYNIRGNCQDLENCPGCSDSTCNKAVMDIWNRRTDIKKYAPSASTNNDYATALKVFNEYHNMDREQQDICSFDEFIQQRLNPPKSADCA
jgi:hypothetical protein